MLIGSDSLVTKPAVRSFETRFARRLIAAVCGLVILASATGCGEGDGVEISDVAKHDIPELEQITEELGCELTIELFGDPLSNLKGQGVICVKGDHQGRHTYLMRYDGPPTTAFDDRIWDPQVASDSLIVFRDGYVLGPPDLISEVSGGTKVDEQQIVDIANGKIGDAKLSEEEFECRSFLASALSGDFVASIDEGQEFVDAEMFSTSDSSGRELVLEARSSLIDKSSDELSFAKESPGLVDYYAEAHASRYADDIAESCASS